MKKRGYLIASLLWAVLILAVQPAFADSGKFYIVGMGAVPDFLTLRGAEVIKNSQIVMLEGDRDREAWAAYIGQKEVWIVPNSARLYFGLDPEKVTDAKLKAKVIETDKVRKELIDRISRAVRAGKTVSALQWGDPMMFGMTYYLEMLPKDIPTEIIPGVGAFQAASAATKMSPPYGWDTNSVILTAAEWPGRTDTNEQLMAHQTSMVFYTMFMNYPRFVQKSESSLSSGHPGCGGVLRRGPQKAENHPLHRGKILARREIQRTSRAHASGGKIFDGRTGQE